MVLCPFCRSWRKKNMPVAWRFWEPETCEAHESPEPCLSQKQEHLKMWYFSCGWDVVCECEECINLMQDRFCGKALCNFSEQVSHSHILLCCYSQEPNIHASWPFFFAVSVCIFCRWKACSIHCSQGMLQQGVCGVHHLLAMSILWLGIFQIFSIFIMPSSTGAVGHFPIFRATNISGKKMFQTKSRSIRQIVGWGREPSTLSTPTSLPEFDFLQTAVFCASLCVLCFLVTS